MSLADRTPHEPGAVDCDVHVAPAAYADLLPYLSDYWRQYLSEAAVRLTGVAHAYPPGAPVTATQQARDKGWAAPPQHVRATPGALPRYRAAAFRGAQLHQWL